MKKHLPFYCLIASFICILASCAKSPEQKAKDLVEMEIKKQLYIPDSYDLADIKFDSAFAPYDSPEFIEMTQELVQKWLEVEETKESVKQAKASVSIWSGPYSSYFQQNSLDEARADLAEAQEKENKVISEVKVIAEKMKKQMHESPKFIGYKASVSYRAKNNDGNVLMSTVFVVFDKDVEKISCMIDGEDYELYQKMIEELQKENYRESDADD
ncbi:MAG: hypothetical protein PUG64_04275 [Bacteroidales bacterium]|nr:hypothetical protein [Bacteroidales bacterium]MDY3912361.1 hypothetical protein [Sodaliphilus sp.]